MSATASTTPYWGRAWELAVYGTPDGSGSPGAVLSSGAWEPEALRVTFDIQQTAIPSPWWFADISVYNMNAVSAQQALFNAKWVTLKAGYQSAAQAQPDGTVTSLTTIWSGAVMQVLYEREGVVDNKVTYHCLATDPKVARNVNFNMGRNATQAQVVSRMIGQVPSAAVLNQYSDALGQNQYVRSRAYFGTTDKYFGRIASGNYMQWFKSPKGVYLGQLQAPAAVPDIVYSPPMPPPPLPANWKLQADPAVTYTILDSPQQLDNGVEFRVLLDPRLIVQLPPLLVKIDNAVIRQIKYSYPQDTAIFPLDQDNLYVVAAVRHYGDTRGNDWCSEVTGYSRFYAQLGARGIFLTGG